jgi:SAM-dependent methyltransferase
MGAGRVDLAMSSTPTLINRGIIAVSMFRTYPLRKLQEHSTARADAPMLPTKMPLFLNVDSWSTHAGEYDFIFSACVFHHIAPALREPILQRLWQSLKPEGLVVVWEHNPWNPITRKVVKDCIFDKDALLLSIVEMIRLQGRTIPNSKIGYRFVTFFPAALHKLQPLEAALGWLPLGAQWVFWAKKLQQ